MPDCRRDMAQLADVMFVMAERDLVELALGRLARAPGAETLFAEHLVDRAQPVGPLGVSGRRQVIEACGMGEKEGHAGPLKQGPNLGCKVRLRKGGTAKKA